MKLKLFLLLSVLFVLDLFRFGPKLVPHFFLVVLVAYLTDYLLIRLRKIQPFFPLASLDTGLVIAFVLDPSSQLIYKVAAPILAIVSKHFLKRGNRHIFNPAAFGLFVMALLGAPISWWVNSTGRTGFDNLLTAITNALLIIGMIFFLIRIRRLRTVLAFLTAFFLVRFLIYQEINLWFSLFFYPLVMLSEPMTSPSDFKEQFIYGALSALLIIFIGFSNLTLVDSFLQTLLIVNLLFSFEVIKKLVRVLPL